MRKLLILRLGQVERLGVEVCMCLSEFWKFLRKRGIVVCFSTVSFHLNAGKFRILWSVRGEVVGEGEVCGLLLLLLFCVYC